jgi:hypothetical protein
MCTLTRAEFEHAGQGVEYLGGRVDIAALLQPRVPRQADARELCDLLTPQSRRAAPTIGLDAHALGRHLRPALAQKVGELGAACL